MNVKRNRASPPPEPAAVHLHEGESMQVWIAYALGLICGGGVVLWWGM